ncbi:MAG: glycosyltransferase family 4 protein [Gammaproteobacteria bacterium]|nr:glycosyltransferase family 4 protein [Gammaproteobacteria bacterium]
MGWRVAPFSMRHSNNIDSPWSDYFVEEIEFGSEYSLWGKIRRVPKVVYSLEARRRVRRLLDVFPADICHAHNIYHHISPSILHLIKQRGIPIVMTLHDLKLACPAYNMLANDGICERCKDGRIYNVLRHSCIKGSVTLSAVVMAETLLHRALKTFERHIDRFIVPSHFYMAKLAEWGWDKSRFLYIPNALDVETFSVDYVPGKSFVYFGRLSREKGISTLIKAASIAGVSLTIVGTGPDEHLLRKLSKDEGADVTFLGYLKGQKLHDVVRSARAVVLPSEWYENAPLSVMEAYALGKPVIGATIGGIPELIQNGITGATFESGSIRELAEILARFSCLPDSDMSNMGHAGRSWIEREFNMDQYGSRMLSLYRELGVQ